MVRCTLRIARQIVDFPLFAVAPNGIMYVKETVRKGLLARMLTELLDTRVMVKQAMKGAKDDKVSVCMLTDCVDSLCSASAIGSPQDP